MVHTPLCDLLQIKYPILQGALGPNDTSDLAIAVCRAGGLGVLSTVETDDIYGATRRHIQKLKKVGASFGVNIPVNNVTSSQRLQALMDEVEEDPGVLDTLKVLITSAGRPEWGADAARKAGIKHFHVVATVRHARTAADAGCAALIAEGNESGGHVASSAGVTTMALVPAVAEEVDIPVVAAGGFIDGRGLVAALGLGAAGIQMGTRFLMTTAAGFVHDRIRSALLEANLSDTVVVPGSLGENRHLRNQFTDDILDAVAQGLPEAEIAEIKRKGKQAKHDGDAVNAAVPVGMAIGRIQNVPTVEELIAKVVSEAQETIKKLS
jgi:NAD(P)H-dependent flavin oxidoreductase YrpB (nitropropane dioxygenase family)